MIDIIKQNEANHWETKEYAAWRNMKQRCRNPKNPQFADYGGRGIDYCEEWERFENFRSDMGECPEGLTLDRIDNNKGYSKENCRWASHEVQMNNRRNNIQIPFQGEVISLKRLGEIRRIPYPTLYMRFRKNGEAGLFGEN